MKKKAENNPNFVIHGENDNGNFKVAVERFFVVFNTPTTKVVIVGIVSEGLINVGDSIILSFANDRTLQGSVKRIEINKEPVSYAVENESIGIELEGIKIKCLRASNDNACTEILEDEE